MNLKRLCVDLWEAERVRATRRGFGVRARRGFTLVELLIVIVIIAAGTVFILPAISNIVSSSRYSNAVNTVSGALGSARARAIENGNAAGLVFLFDIETERYTLQVVDLGEPRATLTNRAPSGVVNQEDIYARGFRPARGLAPVELPEGIVVYGLSFAVTPSLLTDGDDPSQGQPRLGAEVDSETSAWYAFERFPNPDDGSVLELPWLFPRNDPLLYVSRPGSGADVTKAALWGGTGSGVTDAEARRAVRHAQSFIVVFDKSGRVAQADAAGGLTTPNGYLEFPNIPLEIDADPADPETEVQDEGTTFDPEVGLGDSIEANPEVMLRPVSQLAVVDVNEMREALGAFLGDSDPWLYRSSESFGGESLIPDGRWLRQSPTGNRGDEVLSAISRWIDNNAEVLGFNAYTGVAIQREAP